MGKKIKEVLKDWRLRNVSTITVNNASSNDVAVEYLKKKIKNMKCLVMNGFGFHIRCCVHVLNLVVIDGLNVVHTSVSRVQNTVIVGVSPNSQSILIGFGCVS